MVEMNWEILQKPSKAAETRLVTAIIDGTFPVNSQFPAERELASLLGVTRPTLREALQRLARDGWIEIQQGKPTRVRNFWQEGNLGVLSAIAQHPNKLPPDFVNNLLSVRLLLAPAYTRLAIERQPHVIRDLLGESLHIPDTPQAFGATDFNLHRQLTICSGNPIFTLILNGFTDLYQEMAIIYFASPMARENSRDYYKQLLESAIKEDMDEAEMITRQVMSESIRTWKAASQFGRKT